jgi:hypothetical protein
LVLQQRVPRRPAVLTHRGYQDLEQEIGMAGTKGAGRGFLRHGTLCIARAAGLYKYFNAALTIGLSAHAEKRYHLRRFVW